MQTFVLASQVDQALWDTTPSIFHLVLFLWCLFCIWSLLGLECSNAEFSFLFLRISDVRDFVTKYQGSEGSVPFILTTSLPFRELRDETLTLEEAKLQNAVVVQRLRKTTEPFRLLVIKAPDNDYKTAATPNGQLKNEQKNAIKSTRSN